MTVEPPEPYALGELTVDFARCPVPLTGQPLDLVSLGYRLLEELAANAGRVLTYEHLLERVWGERGSGSLRPLSASVSKLRSRLGDDADHPNCVFTALRGGVLGAGWGN